MHKVVLIDAASNRNELEFATIEEAAGSCGYKMPIIFDGKSGYFEFVAVDSTVTRFVETDEVFRHFAYAHLPERLQAVSRRFYELAEFIVLNVPRNPERTVALRKILEGKDCAVRAALPR